ncbi:glycosyltransferase [Haloglycomyces albus]|uniref:glycosyltransferase n=1 Tax=Haloglycomyces albus TaxID=526067 RepID=UPI00046D412C|nr:glycosyltransferase [Haloglycomyces albus]
MVIESAKATVGISNLNEWDTTPEPLSDGIADILATITEPTQIVELGRNARASLSRVGRHLLADLAQHDHPTARTELARTLAMQPLHGNDRALARELLDHYPHTWDDELRDVYATLLATTDPDALTSIRTPDDPLRRLSELRQAVHTHGDVLRRLELCTDWTGLTAESPAEIDSLRGPDTAPVRGGPLISIIMTTFRPGQALTTAVRSVLAQSWQRWELLIVDDASGAEYQRSLEEVEAFDDRIHLFRQPMNMGTYAARNRALDVARGTYVTGLDSDDWMHPQWLERQVRPLRDDPRLVMTLSKAIRLDTTLEPALNPGIAPVEYRSTSAMFRRKKVLDKIGYFDLTRKGADSEYRMRIQKYFGTDRTYRLDEIHGILRENPGSLSSGEIRAQWIQPYRFAYESAFSHWQEHLHAKNAHVSRNMVPRAFYAPRQLRDKHYNPTEFDEVYLADWGEHGPYYERFLHQAIQSADAGRNIALAHYPDWKANRSSRRLSHMVLRAALDHRIPWIDPERLRKGTVLTPNSHTARAVEVDHGLTAEVPGTYQATYAGARKRGRLRTTVQRLPRPVRRNIGRAKAVPRKLTSLTRSAAKGAVDRSPAPVRRRFGRDGSDLTWLAERLQGGFSTTASKKLLGISRSRWSPMSRRLQAAELADHGLAQLPLRGGETTHYDVVFVSNFNMPGGTSSSNAMEMRTLAEAGYKVGIIHHPVWDWTMKRTFNPKIQTLLDDGLATELHTGDSATCHLQIIRYPKLMTTPLEDRPHLTPERTVLVVNQPPYEYYADRGRVLTWDISTVYNNLCAWAGAHQWFLQGPQVRDSLETDHSDEIINLPISNDYWYAVVDVDDVAEPPRRTGDVFRIGRHSRDAAGKWPEDPTRLKQIYPERDDIEVHVLGGATVPKQLLGGKLPSNWTVFDFGTREVSEFLRSLDALVFFRSEMSREAFGRTVVEGMAVGLPCLVPPEFDEVFGDGAIVCDAAEVEAVIDRLRLDEDYYRAMSQRAVDFVRKRFSAQAYLDRVARVNPALQRRTS